MPGQKRAVACRPIKSVASGDHVRRRRAKVLTRDSIIKMRKGTVSNRTDRSETSGRSSTNQSRESGSSATTPSMRVARWGTRRTNERVRGRWVTEEGRKGESTGDERVPADRPARSMGFPFRFKAGAICGRGI